MAKKPNKQDATLINVQAAKKRDLKQAVRIKGLELYIRGLWPAIEAINERLDRLEARMPPNDATGAVRAIELPKDLATEFRAGKKGRRK